jgi:hypothetical protein
MFIFFQGSVYYVRILQRRTYFQMFGVNRLYKTLYDLLKHRITSGLHEGASNYPGRVPALY